MMTAGKIRQEAQRLYSGSRNENDMYRFDGFILGGEWVLSTLTLDDKYDYVVRRYKRNYKDLQKKISKRDQIIDDLYKEIELLKKSK